MILGSILILWIISFVAVEGIIFFSVRDDSMAAVDYILILGAGLRGSEVSRNLSLRLEKGMEYLYGHPNVQAVVSGGQGWGETIPEAEAMKRFLMARGIGEKRIIKEDRSTNTLENIQFTKRILDEAMKGKPYRVIIVTSEYHLFRAKFLARRNGWTAYGMPSRTPFFILLHNASREYFSMIKMVMLGE